GPRQDHLPADPLHLPITVRRSARTGGDHDLSQHHSPTGRFVGRRMRVVALRAEPSLAAALNMTTDWEVVYADDPEQAAQVIAGANVVLIGGGTEEGLRLAESVRTLGITIPAVVVGDTPVSGTERYPVLTPPFTLDELLAVVVRAVAGSAQSITAAAAPVA